MRAAIVFMAGVIFSVGLALAGMTQPQKIIAFLDVFGDWDPSLAFVMAGAILAYGPAFKLITRRKGPVFASLFQIPTRRDITPSLVAGSALFGIGWGIGGLCPGPALASLSSGAPMVALFLVAMLAGMGGYTAFDRWRTAPEPPKGCPSGGCTSSC